MPKYFHAATFLPSLLLAPCFLAALAVPVRAQTAGNSSPAESTTATDAPADVKNTTPPLDDFFHRLAKAYWDDWNGTAEPTPDLPRRGSPAPESSPPFPFADWPYGGSPVIGAPDTSGGPLMTAIYEG